MTCLGTSYYYFCLNVVSKIPLIEKFSIQIVQLSITLPCAETEKPLWSSVQCNVQNLNKNWLCNNSTKLFLMRYSCKK